MLQKSVRWLILLLSFVVLLTGCTKPTKVYTVVEVNNEGYIVADSSNNLFQTDKENNITSAMGQNYLSLAPVAPLSSFGTEYNLSNIELATYSGNLADAAAYCNRLQQEGYAISDIKYNSQVLDIKLSTDADVVRVLYLSGDTVRVFYKNFYESVLFPPYTYD